MDHPDGVYSIHYNSESHFGVIFQNRGSVWKKVLPYAVLNASIMVLLTYLKEYQGIDLSITDKGHSFMTLFVAFLIVSRVSISLGRYNEARANLAVMYRESREMIQNMSVFTKEDQSTSAKEWRHETAYYTCLLLRLAMAVIDYPTDKIDCSELPELTGYPKEFVKKHLPRTDWTSHQAGWENNMRVPIRMAYLVRSTLFSSKDRLKKPLEVWQIGKLFGSVDTFMSGYYGMRKFMTTPFPFPLVQMARTFLFLYVYTLPFALLSDTSEWFAHAAVILLVTYGFVGLGTVSIEMDDPFGDDENDFDNLGMALTAFEDTFLSIDDVDGPEWTEKLRAKMNPGAGGVPTETTALMV